MRPGAWLSPARQRELALAAATGGARERAELVEAFQPLIAGVARNYRGCRRVERDELMQEGVVGLLRALERYDPARCSNFWAYASWWVRQAMQRLLAELGRPVVLSDRALRQLARLREVHREHLQLFGEEPSASVMSLATGMHPRQIERLLCGALPARSLEEPTPGAEGATVGDELSDPLSEDAYLVVIERVAVNQLTGQLSQRERTVIYGRLGIDGERRTLRDLAGDLSVSGERVRQLEDRALRKLHVACGDGPASGRPKRPRGSQRRGAPSVATG